MPSEKALDRYPEHYLTVFQLAAAGKPVELPTGTVTQAKAWRLELNAFRRVYKATLKGTGECFMDTVVVTVCLNVKEDFPKVTLTLRPPTAIDNLNATIAQVVNENNGTAK